MDQSLNMVKIAYDALDDKLAEDIKIIDIRSISVLADYFTLQMVITKTRYRQWWIMYRKNFLKLDMR